MSHQFVSLLGPLDCGIEKVYSIQNMEVCLLTLVDDKAIFGKICSGDATSIGSQEKQYFGRVLPDGINTRFVSQVQGCHLIGHPEVTHI